jgi:hypothetical protein
MPRRRRERASASHPAGCACAAGASLTSERLQVPGGGAARNVCACAVRAGPLGRSGHHLGTGGGAQPTGSHRAGRRRRHEPRIVSEPRPFGAASIPSAGLYAYWGCLARVRTARRPHIRVPLPLTPPLTSGSCPSPEGPKTPARLPESSHPGPRRGNPKWQHLEIYAPILLGLFG